ncbi:MAG: class I SAM-dependent methyltransferase [Gammaproteobacteria bacterium]
MACRNWDDVYRSGAHWETQHSNQAERFAQHLAPRSQVLDAGCGSGRDVGYFASCGHRAVGIDASSVAIARARQRYPSQDIRFSVARIEQLPFRSGAFEAVYCAYTLQDTAYAEGISEIARVLGDGGLAWLTVFTETKYERPCGLDQTLAIRPFIAVVQAKFHVLHEERDEYVEQDEHGAHRHKRLILFVRRLPPDQCCEPG